MPVSGHASCGHLALGQPERDGPAIELETHADQLAHFVPDGLGGVQSGAAEPREGRFIRGLPGNPAATIDLYRVRHEPRLVAAPRGADAERPVRFAAE